MAIPNLVALRFRGWNLSICSVCLESNALPPGAFGPNGLMKPLSPTPGSPPPKRAPGSAPSPQPSGLRPPSSVDSDRVAQWKSFVIGGFALAMIFVYLELTKKTAEESPPAKAAPVQTVAPQASREEAVPVEAPDNIPPALSENPVKPPAVVPPTAPLPNNPPLPHNLRFAMRRNSFSSGSMPAGRRRSTATMRFWTARLKPANGTTIEIC